jgi:hypothetical protein
MGAAEAADPKGVAGKGRRRPAARLGGPTMSKVRKWDGEGTVVGTRGNGEVAPIGAVRRTSRTEESRR